MFIKWNKTLMFNNVGVLLRFIVIVRVGVMCVITTWDKIFTITTQHTYCGFINIRWTQIFVDFVDKFIHEKNVHYNAISTNILHSIWLDHWPLIHLTSKLGFSLKQWKLIPFNIDETTVCHKQCIHDKIEYYNKVWNSVI